MDITYREALREGLREELIKDSRVFLIGEDVGAYGGSYAITKDFLKDFGPERIMDAPLSENGFTGLGIGAALGGMKPIVEIMTVNFSLLALDQIVNSAAVYRKMSGNQLFVPIVIRMTTGGGRQLAAQHSNSFEGWFAHIPGIQILTPSTVTDARYCLSYALKQTDPILIFEHAQLLNIKDKLDKNSTDLSDFDPLMRQRGKLLTIVTYGGMLHKCLDAATDLDVEIIDLRKLRPLNLDLVYESLKKTHKLLIVDEGWKSVSLSSEISARVMETSFFDLDASVERLARKELPVPYAKNLENSIIPQVDDIRLKIKEMIA